MIKKLIASALLLSLTVLLSACGQKGDLYLPTEPEKTDTAEQEDAE